MRTAHRAVAVWTAACFLGACPKPQPLVDPGHEPDPPGTVSSGTGSTLKLLEPRTSSPIAASSGALEVPEAWRSTVEELGEPATATAAVATLVEAGGAVCGLLRDVAHYDEDLSRRGRAVVALTSIGDDCADQALLEIHRYRSAPELVRTWAAAGLLNRARTLDELVAFQSMLGGGPALARPLEIRALALVEPDSDAGALLALWATVPGLQAALAPALTSRPPQELVAAMLTHDNGDARRFAAGLLAGLDARPELVEAVVEAYRFRPGSEGVLWAGGPLYVPSFGWSAPDARRLIGHLIAWHVYCNERAMTGEQQQIYNNLRSVGLHRVAGYPRPDTNTRNLLAQFAQVEGVEALRALLEEQGLAEDPRYSGLLGARISR
jgi:hypothetical protein